MASNEGEYNAMEYPVEVKEEKLEIDDYQDCSTESEGNSEYNCQNAVIDNFKEASPDLVSNMLLDSVTLLSSDTDSITETPSLAYTECVGVSHVKQEDTESKRDLLPIAINLNKYQEEGTVSCVDGKPRSTEIKSESLSTETNFPCTSSVNIIEVETICEYPDEAEKTKHSSIRREVETQPDRENKEGTLISDLCEMTNYNEKERMQFKSGRRQSNTYFRKNVFYCSESLTKTSSNQKSYKCDSCEKEFHVLSALKTHKRIHTGEKPYECEICEHKFIQRSDLIRHVRIHTREKPYKCKMCDYKCTQSSYLKQHMVTHAGEKPYKCEICKCKFASKSYLRGHIGTHTGEEPYQCKFCEYKCIENSALKKHMTKHTGQKPYQCKFCDYKGIQISDLKMHMTKHTGEQPYKCKICNCKFTRSSNFKTHMTNHAGEKPYGCEICNCKFACKDYLKRHIKIHTREKLYQCEICEYKCTRMKDLKTHVANHTR